MEILIDRKWKKDTYTIGNLYVNNRFFSNTLEDKDRGLSDSMPLGRIAKAKVYGETAVPTGTYGVRMTYSSKFATRAWARRYNGKVPELLNVKGFSGVRVHPGNTAKDTLGCVLLGKNTAKGMVSQSTSYYYKLLDDYILPAINRNEKIMLTIK